MLGRSLSLTHSSRSCMGTRGCNISKFATLPRNNLQLKPVQAASHLALKQNHAVTKTWSHAGSSHGFPSSREFQPVHHFGMPASMQMTSSTRRTRVAPHHAPSAPSNLRAISKQPPRETVTSTPDSNFSTPQSDLQLKAEEEKWEHGRRRRVMLWSGVAGAVLCGYLAQDEERVAYMAASLKDIIKIRKIEDSFVLEDQLGEGGFSIVYRGYNKSTRQRVAVKVMMKKNPEVTLVMQDEVELMNAAGKHENLVGLHAVYETPKEWCLILDLADGGALFDRVVAEGTLSENQAANYVLQLGSALLHLHRRSICHGDVKPENLLLSSEGGDDAFANTIKLCDFETAASIMFSEKEVIKLADFGMARLMDSGGMVLDQHTGTLDYWAPEIVRNQACGFPIDMWALGVCIYIMLCGCNPFDPYGRASDSQILANIVKGKIDTRNPVWRHLSEPCRDFIVRLLATDPAARMTSEEAMQHAWLINTPTNLLPAVHKQRLMGYQALHNLRIAIQALGVNVDQMFAKLDEKGTGLVDLDKVFKTVGMKLGPEAIDAVKELADMRHSGRTESPPRHIQRDELRKVLKLQRGKRQELSESQLQTIFGLFDANNKGWIGPQELSHVLRALGRDISMRRCTSIVKKGNKVEEQLDFKQFCKLMKSHVLEEDKDE